jgi:hypothetical protein
LGLGCGEQKLPAIPARELDQILVVDEYPATDAAGLEPALGDQVIQGANGDAELTSSLPTVVQESS